MLDVKQMHADPQAVARNMIVETQHPVAGRVKSIGVPIKFSATPGLVSRAAPVLGQHTREVLRELRFSETDIESLAASGAIQMRDIGEAAAQ